MIIEFKIFENQEAKTEINLRDIWEEYLTLVSDFDFGEFVSDVFKSGTVVEFYCKVCTCSDISQWDKDRNTDYRICSNKFHKAKIKGIGSGGSSNPYLFFSFYKERLNKKKLGFTKNGYISHEVDVDKPIIVYGELSEFAKNVIDKVNIKKASQKFGL